MHDFLNKVETESYEKGFKHGKMVGVELGENRFARLSNILIKNERLDDLKLALEDSNYRRKLFDELVIADVKHL